MHSCTNNFLLYFKRIPSMQRNWMNNSKKPHIPITRRPHLSRTNYPDNVLSSQKEKEKMHSRITLCTCKVEREDELHLKQSPALS